MPKTNQIDGLNNLLKPRMFVLGDSFSTIRRPINGTTPESAANLNINGRYTSTTGLNLWDYLARSFDTSFMVSTTTNYAREGAMAVYDWRSTASWSAINPIPSVGSQMTSLQNDNPANTINQNDVLGILIGTNDKVSDAASTTAADGGAKPTAQQTSDAISNVVQRAITYGFKNIIVLHPEGKWFATVTPILKTALDSLATNNRTVKIVQTYADIAMLEQSNPYHPDGLHPNDTAHKRLGEVLTDAYQQNQLVDLTSSFLVSTRGSSASAARAIGFQNFDPNSSTGHYAQLRIPDNVNTIEAKTNNGVIWRSYNGLHVCGAFEANDPYSGRNFAGGGKNDACLTVWANFWEHQAVIKTENLGGGSYAPHLLCKTGGVDRLKVNNDGTMVIDSPGTEVFKGVSRDGGVARVIVDHTISATPNSSNAQYAFNNNGALKWVNSSYKAGGLGTNFSYSIYNAQTGSDVMYINGDTNQINFFTSSPQYSANQVRLYVEAPATGLGTNNFWFMAYDPSKPTGQKERIRFYSDGAMETYSWINTIGGVYYCNGLQVVGSRVTGWSSGTAGINSVGNATTGTQSISSTTASAAILSQMGQVTLSTTYTASSLQSYINGLGGRINAIINVLRSHGLINS